MQLIFVAALGLDDCFRFFYTARAADPKLDRRTVARPSFRIDTVSTIFWLATPSLMGTD